ncbi:MAG TPA: YfhO family protein, partial [Bacteroidia bacterium]
KVDPSASIKLTNYKSNHLTYESNAATEQLAVFSEIYYKDGWNTYVDGELKPHFSANWILRAMRVPAGKHTIEFKFEPTKFYIGEKISLVSCIVLFVAIAVALFLAWKQKDKA